MKKVIVSAVLAMCSVNALASDWVLPAIGGIIVGSMLNRPSYPNYGGVPQVYGPGGYGSLPPRSIYYAPPLLQQTYNCLVPVRDPLTGMIRNEVMTCVQ
jgi:hypothetical protein